MHFTNSIMSIHANYTYIVGIEWYYISKVALRHSVTQKFTPKTDDKNHEPKDRF